MQIFQALRPEDPQLQLSVVSYHVTALALAGLIELYEERPVRGTVEHLYCVTTIGKRLLEALQ